MKILKTLLAINILLVVGFSFAINVTANEIEVSQPETSSKESTVHNDNTKAHQNAPAKPTLGKRSQVKTLEEFVPSEEVSADKPVAFPTDI